jgi:ribonucleoside-diphosphate reductase alpha chain
LTSAVYSDVQVLTFQDRYAHDGEQFPHQAWRRVSSAVAEAEAEPAREEWAQRFYSLMEDSRYVPGGRILAAMGTGAGVTALNCFVLPSPEDSRQGIVGTSLMQWTEIQSKGGGVGINISSLRPSGDPVRGVNGTSSGPVTWAQLFAYVSHDVVVQGGSRRGAAMIMIDCDHPDVFEFIHAKEIPGRLEGCNMSVCLSDSFMEAVKRNDDWELRWGGRVYRTVRARQIWDEIVAAAWRSAEPGIYFMERANKEANSGYFETQYASNPCGEQTLGPYGACLLGSFNLRAFVKQDPNGTGKVFDFEELKQYAPIAVRFNDNIVDLSHYPLPECRDSQQRIRRMGIGVMGLADALLDLRLRYGSEEALAFTSRVFRTLRDESYRASVALSAERGPFPEFIAEEYLKRPFIKRLPVDIRRGISEYGIRNCYLLSVAPTGTISQMTGVNSGIEPYFDFKYFRRDRLGEYWVKSDWADTYEDKIARPAYVVAAMDVTPEEHVLMQAAAQEFVCSSISKTANLPNSATVEDVARIYMFAYDEGCKSLSVYRDGSRAAQVLHTAASMAEQQAEPDSPARPQKRRRLPTDRSAVNHKFEVDGVEGYLTVGLFEDGAPGEVFINISKQGSTMNGLMDVVAMLLSYCLQYGVDFGALTEKLTGQVFAPAGRTANPDIPFASSIIDYIVRYMEIRWGGAVPQGAEEAIIGALTGETCPACGQMMRHANGCAHCPSCSFERCG